MLTNKRQNVIPDREGAAVVGRDQSERHISSPPGTTVYCPWQTRPSQPYQQARRGDWGARPRRHGHNKRLSPACLALGRFASDTASGTRLLLSWFQPGNARHGPATTGARALSRESGLTMPADALIAGDGCRDRPASADAISDRRQRTGRATERSKSAWTRRPSIAPCRQRWRQRLPGSFRPRSLSARQSQFSASVGSREPISPRSLPLSSSAALRRQGGPRTAMPRLRPTRRRRAPSPSHLSR